MSIWFTADTHFGHCGIVGHAQRPYESCEAMDEDLITKWNSVVKGNDTIYVIGDFAWCRHDYYLGRLKGMKILVTGSHDKMANDIKVRNCSDYYNGERMISIDGMSIWLRHCCPRVWERCHYGVPCFFGHSHSRMPTWNLSRDVGIDSKDANFTPFEWPYLKAWCETREGEMRSYGRIVTEPNRGVELWHQDDVRFWMNKANNMENATLEGLHE